MIYPLTPPRRQPQPAPPPAAGDPLELDLATAGIDDIRRYVNYLERLMERRARAGVHPRLSESPTMRAALEETFGEGP